MKDIIGQDIEIGNMVVFNPPQYKGLTTGKIIGFTPKMVKIEFDKSYTGSKDQKYKTTAYPLDIMVVDAQLEFMYKLKGGK
jgi:hypothetical protein